MKEFFLYKPVSARRTLGGVPVQGFSEDFAYDPIGNRVSATDYDEDGNPRTSLYSANALNQYVSRTVPGWASVRGLAATNAYISVNGNEAFRMGGYYFGSDDFDNSAQSGWAELETYATVNGPTNDFVSAVTNRVFVPQTPETFAYDADGNMIEDGRFRYWWNGENRMVRAEEKMPPEGRAAHVVVYAYDHQGRNVVKDGSLQIWDDYNIVVENATSSNVTINAWGLDIDGTMQGAGGVGGLLAVARNDDMSLPAYDANGNITEYVDSLGGVESHTDYSAFGRGLVRSGLQNHSHGFSTKPWNGRLKVIEYQTRIYNQFDGRWCSRDSVYEYGGLNLYGFAENNVENLFDYQGRLPMVVLQVAVIAAVELAAHYICDAVANQNLDEQTDAYKHCMVSCRYSKCTGVLNGSVWGAMQTLLGGVLHEIMSSNNTLEGAIDDIKSNLIGIAGSLTSGDCKSACDCEKGHWNR